MDPWTDDEFTAQLRQVGQRQYHDRHPFHRLMNEGQLDQDQLRLWVANRFYYQKNIPIKDALLLSRCKIRKVRQEWVKRILDHDGRDGEPGGIERWLRLGEGVGLSRDELEGDSLLLPGVRYAVDAYVNFVASRSWIEGVASSLTELFAPALMAARLEAFEKHYTWIDPAAFSYFRARPPLARRDSEFALSLVQSNCHTCQQQKTAVAALQFKCDLLWAQLDAVYHECVARVPGDQTEQA